MTIHTLHEALAADERQAAQEAWLREGIGRRAFQRALRRTAASILAAHPDAVFAELVADETAGAFSAARIRNRDGRQIDAADGIEPLSVRETTAQDARLHHRTIGRVLDEPLRLDHERVWVDVPAAASRRIDPMPMLCVFGLGAQEGSPVEVINSFVLDAGDHVAWALDGADTRHVHAITTTGEAIRLPIPDEDASVRDAIFALTLRSDNHGDRVDLIPMD